MYLCITMRGYPKCERYEKSHSVNNIVENSMAGMKIQLLKFKGKFRCLKQPFVSKTMIWWNYVIVAKKSNCALFKNTFFFFSQVSKSKSRCYYYHSSLPIRQSHWQQKHVNRFNFKSLFLCSPNEWINKWFEIRRNKYSFASTHYTTTHSSLMSNYK